MAIAINIFLIPVGVAAIGFTASIVILSIPLFGLAALVASQPMFDSQNQKSGSTGTGGTRMTVRTDDYDAIVRTVQLYVDAFNDNDIAKLRQAFDKDAWIF